MARFYSGAGIETLTIETASARDLTWDVFVSHTSKDDDLAEGVAECIRSYGLTAWVDSDHLAPDDDGPRMANKIKRVIRRSYCLMAVVTRATNESWWVPFEIGVASDRSRFLSTYGAPIVALPSFLADWPRVKDHDELHLWCEEIDEKKKRYSPFVRKGLMETASVQQSNYTNEMRAMAKRFPGVR